MNIRSTIIKVKDNRPNTNQKYVLRVHDKRSIGLFNSLVGFTIRRKQKILSSFCIREVIAFPKNKTATDLMSNAPSEVSDEQLKELKIKLNK